MVGKHERKWLQLFISIQDMGGLKELCKSWLW